MHWFSPDPPVPRLLRSLYSPRFPLQGLDVLLFLRGWVPFQLPAFVAMWGEYGRDARYRPGPFQARPRSGSPLPPRLRVSSSTLVLLVATFCSRLFGVSRGRWRLQRRSGATRPERRLERSAAGVPGKCA